MEPEAATLRALDRLWGSPGLPQPTVLVALGKAARGMARAALARFDIPRGLVVDGVGAQLGPLVGFRGGHPLPDEGSLRAGRAALALADGLGPRDTLLCLVSGGGSALIEAPRPGWTLEALRRDGRARLLAGQDIATLNAARARQSLIKAGGLARRAAPARVVTVVLSDVPTASPAVVASGPTALPGAALHLAADNATAVAAVCAAAAARGFPLERPPVALSGEARLAGRGFAQAAAGRALVGGGETVVRVTGRGQGGRNQELALGAADLLRGGLIVALGTDGVDGSSSHAGALIDEDVLARAPTGSRHQALADNDSASWCRAVGAALVTGPTGTNVADLALYLPPI